MKLLSSKNLGKGFTIIEMIVVIAVFLFVVGAALGIFIQLVISQKRVLAQQQILSQISYVQEYMSKALRMAKTSRTQEDIACMEAGGRIYILTQHNGSYKGIKFINQSNLENNIPICQEFYLDGGVLKELKNSINTDDAVALTSSSIVHIKDVKFAINGSVTPHCINDSSCGAFGTDEVQPRVTILMEVFLPNGTGTACDEYADCQNNTKCDMAINQCQPVQVFQTTISQRNLNAK